MRLLTIIAATAALLAATPAAAKNETLPAPTAEEIARSQQLKGILDSLHPVSGDVVVPGADAVLHLGKDYYYLPPEEARRVIVDAWGNPPETAENVLGLVLPAGKTFLDDTWGAVVTWEPMGYVSDDDARTADYGEILAEMQSGEAEINQRRRERGYPAQHLVGWAQPPSYDAASHSVVWAQDIAFEGQSVNSLNYDVRLLGRKGVLSLNMLYSMDKLAETRAAAQAFAKAAEFRPGARYADFKEGDAEAGIGIAGLVAAGVGATVAKKVGLLGLILAFGKKFIVLIVAGLALAGGALKRMLGRKEEEEVWEEPAPSQYEPALAQEATDVPASDVPASDAPEPQPGR